MSEMIMAVAVRFYQGEYKKDKTLLEVLRNFFNAEPTDVDYYEDTDTVEYVAYDPQKFNNFCCHMVNNKLFIDYMISGKDDAYGCDITLKIEDIKNIINKAENMGIKINDYRFKVLYYYNGGCAGLSEVE
jgi:hypothetical protein